MKSRGETDGMRFLEDRIRIAKILYGLDAVLGVFTAGAVALHGAAWSTTKGWTPFVAIFVPASLLWLLLCYGAYRGLTSRNILLKAVFWLHVAFNVFPFPVGTAIAGVAIWLWRGVHRPPGP